jgi:hypothetical protein
LRHRGQTRTVSFRLSGKPLEALERRAEDFKVSPGEYSRAAVEGHLNNDESRRILELIEALSEQHARLSEILCEQMQRLTDELTALRRDFNIAVGRKE